MAQDRALRPGGGQSTQVSLHISRRNSATRLKKGEVDLYQPWSDLDPYPLVSTSIFTTR